LEQDSQPGFFLVVFADAALPTVERFSTVEALREAIMQLVDAEVYAVAFHGHHLPVTKKPWRYLLTPSGPVPLFDLPTTAALEVDGSNYFGQSDNAHTASEELELFERERGARVVNNNYAEDDGADDELSVH
jgi:hypothetical protein